MSSHEHPDRIFAREMIELDEVLEREERAEQVARHTPALERYAQVKDEIDEACDRGDLSAAIELNGEARRLERQIRASEAP